MYSAIKVAAELVRLAHENNVDDMTPIKLMKILYITHGWYMGITGKPLFGERVEAWQFGPVIPEVYDEIKQDNKRPVPRLIEYEGAIDDEEALEIIHAVFETHKDKTAGFLVNVTHQDDTPWHKSTQGGTVYGAGFVVHRELIKEYYRGLIDTGDQHGQAAQ